jgi:hypothetical protein
VNFFTQIQSRNIILNQFNLNNEINKKKLIKNLQRQQKEGGCNLMKKQCKTKKNSN